ncbi:MAG: hypothetical protein IJO33_00075 [Bacilli bacterium]|nr:hypothetical protein [Bacilli bacterium]
MKKKIGIFILLVLVICLSTYIAYDKLVLEKQNEKVEEKKEESNNKNNIVGLLPDFTGYIPYLWDYNYLYNYYFTMEDGEEGALLFNKFEDDSISSTKVNEDDFYKIENNKLYWKIEGKWVLDKVITEDVVVFDSIGLECYDGFTVLTNNNLYQINGIEICPESEIDYSSFVYNEIELPGKVSDVKAKIFPADCDTYIDIYYVIDNRIYIFDENQLVEVVDFFENQANEYETYMEYLENTCNGKADLKINFDGSLRNYVDKNGENIFIKYYIKATKYEDNNYNEYNIIVDKNNFLYVVDFDYDADENLKIEINYVDVIKNIKIDKTEDLGENVKNVTIELSNGETIKIGDN